MTAGEVEEDEEEQEDLDLTGCICPKCGDGEGLREILYGLMGPVDEDKFIVGGCCVDDDSPFVGCVKCGWRGSSWFFLPTSPLRQMPPYIQSK